MGFDCDKHGKPGDRYHYEPDNEWEEPFNSLRKKALPDYFADVLPTFVLDPPPADPRLIDAEIDDLRRWRDTERAALRNTINFEKDGIKDVFEQLLGYGGAPPGQMPATRKLMAQVDDGVLFWIVKKKAEHNRGRPVQWAPDLDPDFCPGHASYPSGHAGESQAIALALIDALGAGHPELHQRLLDTAVAIGWHREVAGVHFPSDSECGRRLAAQFIAALRGHASYASLVAAAHTELDALLGPP